MLAITKINILNSIISARQLFGTVSNLAVSTHLAGIASGFRSKKFCFFFYKYFNIYQPLKGLGQHYAGSGVYVGRV